MYLHFHISLSNASNFSFTLLLPYLNSSIGTFFSSGLFQFFLLLLRFPLISSVLSSVSESSAPSSLPSLVVSVFCSSVFFSRLLS
jgi:hypothetical protein